MDKEIKEFTNNIGATTLQNSSEHSVTNQLIKQIFKRPNYFIKNNDILIIKISRTSKPFFGLGKKVIDIITKNYFLVLLDSDHSGWVYSKSEVVSNIENDIWRLGKNNDYKINILKDRNRFLSCKDFLRKTFLVPRLQPGNAYS